MRVMTRFVAYALWACCLTALPSYADDNPWAHLGGFRCEPLKVGESLPDFPVPSVLACQISDGGTPVETGVTRPTASTAAAPILDSFLNRLSNLNHFIHNSWPKEHDTNTAPPPTP